MPDSNSLAVLMHSAFVPMAGWNRVCAGTMLETMLLSNDVNNTLLAVARSRTCAHCRVLYGSNMA